MFDAAMPLPLRRCCAFLLPYATAELPCRHAADALFRFDARAIFFSPRRVFLLMPYHFSREFFAHVIFQAAAFATLRCYASPLRCDYFAFSPIRSAATS